MKKISKEISKRGPLTVRGRFSQSKYKVFRHYLYLLGLCSWCSTENWRGKWHGQRPSSSGQVGTSGCETSHANILAVGCAAQGPRASGSHFHHDPEADLDPFAISISFNGNNQIISISLHLTENWASLKYLDHLYHPSFVSFCHIL
jgi:hypothetical protein